MRFRHLQVKNGLSQNGVNCVIKDKNGFYWIGTQYGINRFDGKNIKQYFTYNTNEISDNYIFCAIEDAYGNILFGTRNHITKYNINTNKFSTILIHDSLLRFHTEKLANLASFTKDDIGNIYFAMDDYVMQISAQESQKAVPVLKAIKINTKFHYTRPFIKNNELYTGFLGSRFLYKNKLPLHKHLTPYDSIAIPHNNILTSLDVYLTSPQPIININGIVFKIKNDSLIELFKEASLNSGVLSCVYYNQQYYVGTHNGIYIYSTDSRLNKIITHSHNNPFSLADGKIYSISDTKDGLLWFGNTVEGVNIFDTKNQYFETVKPFEDKPYNALSCLLKNDSTLLIGSLFGIDEFKCRNNKWKLYKSGALSKYKITTMCTMPNAFLFGTTNGLFVQKNNGEIQSIKLENNNAYVYDLKNVSDKQIIVSSSQGLHVLNSSTYSIVVNYSNTATDRSGKKPVASYYVLSTSVNKNKEYTVNTIGGSTLLDSNYQFKTNYFQNFKYTSPTDLFISKSIDDGHGTIWFSSMSNGVYKYQNNQFIVFNQKNGLCHNVISSIETDVHKNLWISTNNGINCIKKNGGIETFVNQLELETPEFTLNASIEKNNQMFFCSNGGLVIFNADTVLKRFSEKEYMTLNLNTIIKNYTDTVAISNYVELKHEDKMLLFNFSVPSYRHFEDIVLMYQLEGFDTQWHVFKNGGDVLFNSLPYGEYTLFVKAQVKNGNVNTNTQKINIIVSPPFWRRAWFIAIIVLLLLSLMSFVGWYISRIKFKKQLIQLEINQKIHAEKERISHDLHDNIGSHISTLITGLDKISITKTTDNAERLSDYARNTLSELRETIWALNTNEIDLQLLKQKTEDLLFDLRTTYDEVKINSCFNFSANYILNHKQTLLLYRIMQEAIANALKHSGCNQLSISITEINKKMSLIVKDNGNGFDVNARKKGHHGLDNMQSRAQQGDINYSIVSSKNNGTEITLILQIL